MVLRATVTLTGGQQAEARCARVGSSASATSAAGLATSAPDVCTVGAWLREGLAQYPDVCFPRGITAAEGKWPPPPSLTRLRSQCAAAAHRPLSIEASAQQLRARPLPRQHRGER